MRLTPRPGSIRARYTLTATALTLLLLAIVGISLDLAIRERIKAQVFSEAERVASQWSAAARIGAVPHAIPAFTRINLIQLVDARDRVLNSSRAAAGRPALSTHRPPSDDRFNHLTECAPRHRCVMLMAIRVTPAPDSPVVYAGTTQPAALASNGLEYGIAVCALCIVTLAAWLTWVMVGRTLRPVEAIRARMSEITGTDLSLRVPLPPGHDEIAQLARTANQTLARLEAAVEQQRQFASDTSHELRSPLSGLRTRLEEAVLYPDDVDPHDTIRAALSATDRLEAITSDLLILARLRATDPAPPEPIDLGALVREEIDSRVQGMPVRVEQATAVWVMGSRIQLIRVLDNLLDNAHRHAESAVEVTVEPVDGQAVVTVTDDGAGIASRDRERVFERFTRLADGRRRDPGGSGLGLAISRDITHAHHGTLKAEDSPHGARFVLRLPLRETGLVSESASAADDHQAIVPAPAGRSNGCPSH
ncbi:ATP-binding protein [Actinomadura sp. HBU206391]|uniref:HAMP domain-containing sensor histidine kinase n=1 Tax=Actinomadura sp. HBU206391 TaxID=2731692 RepID=UPI00164F55D0|nr:HAMP domain-containing sensor histidine kinase [Actinomadura sp. HBU206391]MBC6459598.1 HAMP domain-containing histidine kinase [Actinomadura sp. HBU206391]